jgi:hypothetical protein
MFSSLSRIQPRSLQDTYVSASLVFPTICKLQDILKAGEDDKDEVITSMKSSMLSALSNRFAVKFKGEKDIPILILASAVDPRYKRLTFLNDEQREVVKSRLIKDIKLVIEQEEACPPHQNELEIAAPPQAKEACWIAAVMRRGMKMHH